MKHVKKLISILLGMVMMLVMTTTAFAEETKYSITITNTAKDHTYEAYQIFTGTLSTNEDGKKVLSDVKWGSNATNTGAVDDSILAGLTLDKAKGYVDFNSTPAGTSTFDENNGKYVIANLPAGYYLVKDKDASLTGSNDAYTEYIIQVVENVTTEPKSDVPEVTKKVKDANDSTGEITNWQDSADHDIGDHVAFQLKATLADNVSAYTTYKVIFHDTQSKGLTYDNNAVVKIGDKDVTSSFTITSSTNNDGSTALTISCDDVKALGAVDSSVITVEYTATLNTDAIIGSAGNPNTVYLEYSNNPNKSEGGNNETGNTPSDTVIVFTYKTIVNKVDSEGNALTGAAFKLEKLIKGKDGAEDTWQLVKAFTVDEKNPASQFTFTGLDDGKYKLTETTTPEGYNTIDPIEFTVTAEHDIESDSPALTSLSGNVTTGTLTFTSDKSAGSLSTDVENRKGSLLPTTGGMGTTLLYIIGGVLVVGAGVLLVTRKRMGADK